ncbi:MAG: ABC transporter permease [Coriobacteriales bacterium]|nr:ABC transporter permease [Coriobacteriales bacterium]
MRSLTLEFAKLQRKRVLLIVLALVAAVLAWLFADAQGEGRGSATGWHSLFFAAPIMNSVFLSLLCTVVASRVADIDHEANAWKQLLCLQGTGSLLAAKLVCALLVVALAVALELGGIVVIGRMWEFIDLPNLGSWVSLALSQLAASLCMVSIIGAVALLWENQFVAVASGLTLSLAGLFSSFLPTALQRLIPSGYYTLLTTMQVIWGDGSSVPVFYETALPLFDYALVAACSAAACVYAYTMFSRREV